MKKKEHCFYKLFLIGGLSYGVIELLWRRYTHWSMILTGGVCFIMLYRIFKYVRDCTMMLKCCIGSIVITLTEFFAGFLFNHCLKMKIWDYSDRRLNFCGQVCVLYSFLWGLLTIPVSFVCKKLHEKYRW